MQFDRFRGKALLSLLLVGLAPACGSASGAASSDSQGVGLPANAAVDNQVTPGGNSGATSATNAAVTTNASAKPSGPLRGINLAGADFGGVIPGTEGKDYQWPTASEVDYFMSKGMNVFRVEFAWERLQRSAHADFEAPYFAKLDALVAYATSRGAHVILNPQNFARYYGNIVGSSGVPNDVFVDLWRRLSAHFGSNANVIFNLVNEPHDMPTEQWVSAANAAILGIRATGATNTILVPGNAWTGAHSWTSTSYGTPNAVAMLNIDDPADNLLFEVHNYFDTDGGGSSDQCVSATVGSERLGAFIAWLRQHGKKGFVGEFAAGDNPTCRAAIDDALAAMAGASDVLVGWAWWAAGPAWGDYTFSLEPKSGAERSLMTLLRPYLGS